MADMKKVQALHFKGGQGAKTGTGSHLPGNKEKGKIEEDFKALADEVRHVIPIGFKLSAQHIEADIKLQYKPEPPATTILVS